VPIVAPAPSADPLLSGRRCRKCFKLGTAQRVAGSDRTVKCTACGNKWDIRLKGTEKVAVGSVIASARPIKAAPSGKADECRICEHDRTAHVGDGGKCLIPRCVCREFYQ
jgi:hypothetical protein